MTDYHEIVDLQQFARIITGLAVALPVIAVLVGLIVGSMRRNVAGGLLKGLAIGLLGPIIYGLWLLYSHLIRYNPQTGYVGLHHVSVLLLNVAIFAVIGIILGLVYSRIFRASAPPSDEPSGGAV